MAYTEEASKFDAQKNKLKSLCDEHDLIYSLNVMQYPITLTISKATKRYEQPGMFPEAQTEAESAIDPNAKIVWTFKDAALSMKVSGGTFTIGKELRTKIENIFLKLVNFWNQFFFRDALEKNMLKEDAYPEIPESDDTVQAETRDDSEDDEDFEEE